MNGVVLSIMEVVKNDDLPLPTITYLLCPSERVQIHSDNFTKQAFPRKSDFFRLFTWDDEGMH